MNGPSSAAIAMHSGKFTTLILGLLAIALTTASGQMFLRLDGITGAATDTNHVGWIEIQSGAPANLRRLINTNAQLAELCFTKLVDTASPRLALRCASGVAITNGTLDFTVSGASLARYYRLNLTNIYVTAVSQASGGLAPSEEVCLLPQVYSWNYVQYRANGLPASYNYARWSLANTNLNGSGTNPPAFAGLGIRNTTGVQLRWDATAGQLYRIYAVPALGQTFVPIAQFTATSTGATNYNLTTTAPAMFYTVEAVPPGY
ncbi:MAG: type VI secretion system tube protein Hcp [Verrucomicrobiota bacterium]